MGLEGKLSKSATVYSNDPVNKVIRLTLAGEVKPYISVKPRRFIYITGKQGQVQKRSVRISSLDGQPFKILDIKSTLAKGVIKYDTKEIEPGKEYELTVEATAEKIGRFGGNIELTIDHPAMTNVDIRVNIDVRGEVIIIPQLAGFGSVNFEKAPKGLLQRRILVRRENNKEFQLTHTRYDEKRYNVEIKKASNGATGYEVLITLLPGDFPKGPFYDEIQLKTDVESQPVVTIPVSASFQ